MKTIIAFVALVGLCNGQMTSTGTCSTPKAAYFIDRDRLLNYKFYWAHYELPAPATRVYDCSYFLIDIYPPQNIPGPELPITYSIFNSNPNTSIAIGAFLLAPIYNGGCVTQSVYNVTFVVSTPTNDAVIVSIQGRPLYIIGTDYENWMVIYMCNQLATTKEEFLYILGTAYNTTMPAQAVTDARAAINAAGLSDSVLVPTNFDTKCSFRSID